MPPDAHTRSPHALPALRVPPQDASGRTALYLCSRWAKLEVARALLDAVGQGGAAVDVNLADRDGESPLWAAARWGHADLAAFLVERGADRNQARRGTGATPLFEAARLGHDDVVAVLLAPTPNRAEVDKADAAGDTPLRAAARAGHAEICRALIAAGAKEAKAGTTAEAKALTEMLDKLGVSTKPLPTSRFRTGKPYPQARGRPPPE